MTKGHPEGHGAHRRPALLRSRGRKARPGNVLVQARTLGVDLPDLAVMRALVRRTHEVRRFEPRADLDWAAAELRLSRGRGT